MKLYELTYLTSLDLQEDAVKSLQENITSFILEHQGTLDRIEDVVKKRLGEPTKNQTAVQMATLSFYANPEKVEELEKKIKSEPKIIHYIFLNKKLRKAEPPRRIRKPIVSADSKGEEQKTADKSQKVEIKEIEKKLEEILGE
jgi:ribosomal protein S6